MWTHGDCARKFSAEWAMLMNLLLRVYVKTSVESTATQRDEERG